MSFHYDPAKHLSALIDELRIIDADLNNSYRAIDRLRVSARSKTPWKNLKAELKGLQASIDLLEKKVRTKGGVVLNFVIFDQCERLKDGVSAIISSLSSESDATLTDQFNSAVIYNLNQVIKGIKSMNNTFNYVEIKAI